MLYSAYSLDSQNVWAASGFGDIMHTDNGGNSWSSQYSGLGSLNSIHFIDQQNGCAVGASGKILHTANGGTNWQIQNSSVKN
jgi:photosystem II stability/assembly factor-like uncharacterized protein